MRILSVVGARPQFIKAAPVSRAIRERHTEILLHTGQHYDDAMSGAFFRELRLPEPDHNLGVGSGPHGVQTAKMLVGIETVLLGDRPDAVLVYGDTNSTIAGALAAVKLHIPVAHVEAGLRSFDRRMPEEHNRVLTDHASDLLFCPTETAVQNLAREGVTRGVHRTGDVMVDAFRFNVALAKESSVVERCGLRPEEYWLATVHRASNTDERENLQGILTAFRDSGEPILLALHPRTLKMIREHGLDGVLAGSRVKVVEPLSYLETLAALSSSKGVLTDSGGLQKEAYLAGKTCITLRENTEWVETVEDGWNVLVGASQDRILGAMRGFRPRGKRKEHWGDGHAAQRIVRLLEGLPK
ncbi:MAG: non-hydrolyzing UDP-N-acetylglucosamine 2-epimerase [Methanobacteriota archaeon]